MPPDKFHCVECRGRLIAAPSGGWSCELCRTPVAIEDGILDFVRGRADTMLDAATYDEFHGINEGRSDAHYRDIKHLAGEKWPVSLGSVLEIGCGTGLLSRALISHGEARDLVLTDVSVAMLRTCRANLGLAGLLDRMTLTFATHSAIEPCFRDVAFDTCAGSSVLHHITDVRAFLSDMFRWLKPGGRAFFMEPNLRYNRALAHTLSDVLALLYVRDGVFSEGRQALLNVLAEGRRVMLHQRDIAFLATLEDKHMFDSETFEAMGRDVGFAASHAIPTAPQPTGAGHVGGLCAQLGVDEQTRADVLGLLEAYSGRYMSLLSPRDQAGSYLLWLEKGMGPRVQNFRAPPPSEPPPPADTPEIYLTGGVPPRWSLRLTATETTPAAGGPDRIELLLEGWCLVNTDVSWVRVTLQSESRDAPVWLPRPDVHQALVTTSVYATWNSLCCGVRETLLFDGVTSFDQEVELRIEIILASGATLRAEAPPRLRLGEPISVTQ